MPDLPVGTVTFLFTDIEGSTRLWQQYPEAMPAALARHHAILQAVIEAQRGYVFQIVGDAFCAAFYAAREGLAAALAAQRALCGESWGETGPLRVRMGLHTGPAEVRRGDYTSGEYVSGLTLSRTARLMAAGHGGQILLSLPTYDVLGESLPAGVELRDLGIHRMKGLSQPEHIFQVSAPDLPKDFPPLGTLDIALNNLPAQVTSFIGREREVAEIAQRLGQARLVTLTGPGGSGKTRLAQQVAAGLLPEFRHGVWLVELAAVADAALVVSSLAAVLSVREDPGRPLPGLVADYLRGKRTLVVLDNCEHLIDACARLAAALLRECPHVRILATSREALRVAGEAAYRVPPLSLPEERHAAPVERLLNSEAVRLFVERAADALPGFAVTPANAPAVAQVCRRLDGMPLALELAAARVPMLRVEQLARRLDDRFTLLTGGSRTALPRQQTLRATIDWSHELLAERERVVLRRLAVFAGGWTLAAAEAVGPGGEIAPNDLLDLLAGLAGRSMIVLEREPGRDSRYRMLETIREYAWERLREAGEVEFIRNRHVEWCLRLAEDAEPHIYQADLAFWWEQLLLELDNIRAALAWALEQNGNAAGGLRLASALWRFWTDQGLVAEGARWLEAALVKVGSRNPDVPPEVGRAAAVACSRASYVVMRHGDLERAAELAEAGLELSGRFGSKGELAFAILMKAWTAWELGDPDRAEALFRDSLDLAHAAGHRYWWAVSQYQLAGIAFNRGDYTQAASYCRNTLAILRDLGDHMGVGDTLRQLGSIANVRGDYDEAQAMFQESLACYEELGLRPRIGHAHVLLGALADNRQDFVRARTHLERALELFRELGNRPWIGDALWALGNSALREGDYERATVLLENSLAINVELDHKSAICGVELCLGIVARSMGEYKRALLLFRQSLTRARELKLGGYQLAEKLEEIAIVFAAQGRHTDAARLFGVAEAIREAVGASMPPADRVDYDRAVISVRGALGEGAFASALAEGRAMTAERAVAFALEATA